MEGKGGGGEEEKRERMYLAGTWEIPWTGPFQFPLGIEMSLFRNSSNVNTLGTW